MKKSLLALAVVAMASSASAATVYDKDGTTLAVGGRVQTVYYSGNFNKAADRDGNLNNSARFSLSGRTQLFDGVAGIAFAEWDMADNGNQGNGVNAREQWVGADFGDFGKVQAGKNRDALYNVQAPTDIFEDCANVMVGTSTGDYRNGQLNYIYENYGVFAKLTWQSAANGINVEGDKSDVNGGFAGALGYTFDNVVFGPLAFKAGYSYIDFQDIKHEETLSKDATNLSVAGFQKDKYKSGAVSIAWGTRAHGPYFAAVYQANKTEYKKLDSATVGDYEWKQNGFELVAGYTFDNGVQLLTGYEVKKQKKTVNGEEYKQTWRKVPVLAMYRITPNFHVWGEAQIDAGSSSQDENLYGKRAYDMNKGEKFAIGARYVF